LSKKETKTTRQQIAPFFLTWNCDGCVATADDDAPALTAADVGDAIVTSVDAPPVVVALASPFSRAISARQ
jgi:hypothetical protein